MLSRLFVFPIDVLHSPIFYVYFVNASLDVACILHQDATESGRSATYDAAFSWSASDPRLNALANRTQRYSRTGSVNPKAVRDQLLIRR